MAYPRRLLTEGEEILREFNPHWRVLLLAGVYAVLAIAALIGALTQDGALAWVLVVAGLAVIGVGVIPPVLRWKFRLYVLTNERIIVRDGIISRGGIEIPLESINNVIFNQRVFERLLGYGDVLIESAGSQGQSRLSDVPDPEMFQSEVSRIREARSKEMSGGFPAPAAEAAPAPRDPTERLAALADLHDRGALTDAEFEAQKAKLLDEM